jgi:hypothetical protein
MQVARLLALRESERVAQVWFLLSRKPLIFQAKEHFKRANLRPKTAFCTVMKSSTYYAF